MNQMDLREVIKRILETRTSETVAHLAAELNVSIRTIKYDIEALTCSFPIETVRGRYGGGVRLSDWYHPTRTTLCPEQVALLKKLAPSLQGDDLAVMNSILSQFAP